MKPLSYLSLQFIVPIIQWQVEKRLVDTPEENLIVSQQIEKTMKAIDRLPDIYKDVMLLYIEGYALDDIADELDISLSNTKIRVKRGKDFLAEALKDSPLAQKRTKKAKK